MASREFAITFSIAGRLSNESAKSDDLKGVIAFK